MTPGARLTLRADVNAVRDFWRAMKTMASDIFAAPDIAEQAAAFCAWFRRLREPGDLASAFSRWTRSKGFGPTVRQRIAGEVSRLLRGEGER